jgi:hypothetical protein
MSDDLTSSAAPVSPPRKGCFGKSCLIFVVMMVLFAFAIVAGGVWALRSFREKYSSPEPLVLPTANESAPAASAPPAGAAPLAQPTPTAESPTTESGAAPETSAAAIDTRPPLTRWTEFERAGKRGQRAQIALTAAEINALFASDKELQGRGFVSINNNVGRLQFSIPLDRVVMLGGRYLNGEASIAAAPDGDPGKVRIFDIVVAGQSVPESVLDQTWFGGSSVRSLMTNWFKEHNVSRFDVRDNVVIGETSGAAQ